MSLRRACVVLVVLCAAVCVSAWGPSSAKPSPGSGAAPLTGELLTSGAPNSQAMDLDANKKFAYVANFAGNGGQKAGGVWKVDIVTRPTPAPVQLAPKGQNHLVQPVAVFVHSSGAVTVVDAGTTPGTVAFVTPAGALLSSSSSALFTSPLDAVFDPTGAFMYLVNDDGTIVRCNAGGAAFFDKASCKVWATDLGMLVALTFSADARYIFAVTWGATDAVPNTLWRVRVADAKASVLYRGPYLSTANDVTLSPDGKSVVVADIDLGLFSIKDDGTSKATKLTLNSAGQPAQLLNSVRFNKANHGFSSTTDGNIYDYVWSNSN